jgi:hypothetical protein
MQRIEAANAFYVKLGTAGSWAENAIAQNKFASAGSGLISVTSMSAGGLPSEGR